MHSTMEQSNRQYTNSPIHEAVCEFRFPPGPDTWNLAFPGLIYNELKESFPRRIQQEQPQQVFSFSFGNPQQLLGGLHPGDPSQSLGFWKEDKEDGAITISPNQIGISNYRPYPGWEQFHSTIKQAYDAYLRIAEPRLLDRVGLRYINVIEFEAEPISLPEFFYYFPNFGPSLPRLNQNLRMSVDFSYHDNRDIARLQLAIVPGENPNPIAVSLDIDYFFVIPGSVQFEDIEEWLSQAHAAIGSLFEGSITDRARAMFGG